MKDYIKLIRVKHWLKNVLVFLPLFFSMNILNIKLLEKSLFAFAIFCLASSIVYVINDINDIEKDRNHPVKKDRPLASGRISINKAKLVVIVLFLILIASTAFSYLKVLKYQVFIIPAIYIILNILYSKWLKHIPIIDVVILVSGFVLRVLYGAVLSGCTVSKYLYLMIVFGSFYLGFGKRRNEILKNGDKSREVLAMYNENFLDKNMYVAFALAIVAYTLWAVDPTVIARVGNDYLFLSIPLVMVIMQLYSLNIEKNSHGDPIEVIMSNKVLLLSVVVYLVLMIMLVYVI